MPLPFAALIPLIAAGIGAGGAIGGAAIHRGQSKQDIANQNAYNHPAQQLARLREAGLPFAAYAQGQSGNQSALPQASDAGLTQGSQSGISNFITTSTQLKQLELLKAEIRQRNAEADLKNAERDWLLSGRGEDKAGTNLTNNLRTQQEFSKAQATGAQLANKIQDAVARNTPTRLMLENTKLISDIEKTLSDKDLIKEHTKGAELENKIKRVLAAYQPSMSNAQLERLLKSNQLLDLNIEGTRLDNALSTIRNRIAAATEFDTIRMTKVGLLSAVQNYEVAKEYFNTYQQYQMFVRRVQDAFANEKDLSFGERWKAILAGIYTSIMGNQGSGNLPGLLNSLGGSGTINYTGQVHRHFHDYHD